MRRRATAAKTPAICLLLRQKLQFYITIKKTNKKVEHDLAVDSRHEAQCALRAWRLDDDRRHSLVRKPLEVEEQIKAAVTVSHGDD